MSAVIIFLLLCAGAFATDNLDMIEVNAEKKVQDYTFTQTEKLEEEELERAPLPLASQVLERVPGLISSQNGGPGGRTTFFIRGAEARHIFFTLDGLKLNDPTNTDRQFDAAFLTLTAIEEIAVHKGPQAILYGSDAVGGHVEMVTRKGNPKREKKLTVFGGSFGTAGASFRHDWEKGTLSVIRHRTDGVSRYNKKRFDATERDGSEMTQITSSSRHTWEDNFSTNILASFIEGGNELDISGDRTKERSRNNQYLLQQKSTLKLRKNSALSLRNGLNRHERQIATDFGRQKYNGNIFQNELLWENGDSDARMVSGISLEEETLQLSERKAFILGSLFTQGLVKNGPYSLQGGIRSDHHSRYGDFFAGSAGVAMESGAGNWSFQYSRGFKAPSLYQLYGPPLTFYPVVGNRGLEPEINQSYEARWRKHIASWEFQNVLFVSRLSNLITFSATDGYRNQGRFIAEGIEPSVKWAGDSLEVRASFTHQRFRDTEAAVLLRPYNHGQLRASWFFSDSLELYANGRWFDSRKDRFLGKEVRLNSFETFDLGGVYRWNSQEVSVQVQNLLDRNYEEIAGFSVLPRALFGSYGVLF